MNKAMAETISRRAVAALRKEFGDQFTVNYKGGTFGEGNLVAKYEFAEHNLDGEAITRDFEYLRMEAPLAGIGDVLLFDFAIDGSVYHFTGFRPRGKYNWLAANPLTGQRVKLTLTHAKYVVKGGARTPRGQIGAALKTP